MATPRASDILGHVTLVTGPEEFLNQRTISAAVVAVHAFDPESEVSETTADQVTMGVLGDLAAPSLFSSIRCVVLRGLEDLPEETHAGLLDYAAAPSEDIGLILVHSGGQKGSGLLTKLRKVASVTEVKSASLKPSEFSRFVSAEVRGHGGRIAEDAADLLVQAIGQDLRALAGAASQLASDFPGEPLTESVVRKYFGGRAEVKSFAIADAALYGRTAVALEELRWALDNGTASVLVTSAFATGLRGLARFKSAPRGLREADLAREAGVPPWKIRVLREQARGWDDLGLATAITAVARADADVKGQAGDAAYSLERMVLTITGAHGGGR
ncbi:DNA polymerase III subunit delta [Nocardioides panacis]|uniref:DNA polymerase III subunit delta n=1 Tax=Nocardioides panacis TaxID=2849501 RepID=A0A975SVA4_9ACTN|nr:DNA polymerase III subunit delta [Nocardioides panacis]QWZ06550.1 DNA polymerase III subunit delta [Nocardioides panacis]